MRSSKSWTKTRRNDENIVNKTYEFNSIAGQRSVTVNGDQLSVKSHPNNESLTDFSWSDLNVGYSILVDLFGEDEAGLPCEEFVEKVITNRGDHWILTDEQIRDFARVSSRGHFAAQEAAEGRTAPDYAFEIPEIVADHPDYHGKRAVAKEK